MKKIFYLIVSLFISLEYLVAQDNILVKFETSKGDFIVRLYDDTPLHKENFIKNIKSKAYEKLIFHRVIESFVVQGGNPNSRNIDKDAKLEEENSSLLINAEIMPNKHVHHRGALAAARQADDLNPERKSSPMQFYIVTGEYFTSDDLDDYENINNIKYTKEQREKYLLNGGTPSLDGAYTVFGEVVDGYDVIDDIQRVKVNEENSRPLKNIIIYKAYIYQKDK